MSHEIRILIVDAVPDNAFLLQYVLERQGYQIESTGNEDLAFRLIEASPPDLVLLDVIMLMPGVSSFDLLQQIRQNPKSPSIPVILTTCNDFITPFAASQIGANGLIYKPIDFDRLLEQIRNILISKKDCKILMNCCEYAFNYS